MTMYDMKNLAKLKRLDEKNSETMKAFWAFDKAAFCSRSYRHIKQTTDGCGRRSHDAVSVLYRIAREVRP